MSSELTGHTQERRGTRPPQKRRPRVTGEERELLHRDLKKDYDAGASIRDLAEKYDLSFGLARVLLLEAGVTMRTRVRRAPKP
jgi:hypothetical protein